MSIRKSGMLYRFIASAALLGAALFGQAGHAAAASIIYVKYNAVGANNGTSWANAYRNLQTALSTAISGEQIWVAAGQYRPTTGTNRAVSFVLRSGVAVYGGFAGTETLLTQRNWVTHVTILTGDIGAVGDFTDDSYHVVVGSSTNGSAVLDGFHIVGGYANGTNPANEGGGIYDVSGSPTLRNLVVSGNYSGDAGGGLYASLSNSVLKGVTFSGNTAFYYGGGVLSDTSNLSLSNVVVSNNQSGDTGGGMENRKGKPTLTNVTFSGNSATYGGGGVYTQFSPATLSSVTFSGNTSPTGSGGGLDNYGGNLALTNVTFKGNSATNGGGMVDGSGSANFFAVTFSGNKASNIGGGLYEADGLSPFLTSVTFTGNAATSYGGGMYVIGSTPSMKDIVFSGNQAGAGGGMYVDEGNVNMGPSLNSVTFSKNQANAGGGMYNNLSGPSLVDVTFSGNLIRAGGQSGGGMYNYQSKPNLRRVSFIGNKAITWGGGMYNAASGMISTDLIFSGNSANDGAGMFNDNGSNPDVNRATFSGNTAATYGGGMFNNSSAPTLENVTFSGNAASSSFSGQGGGMFNQASAPTLTNTTFSGNSAPAGGGGMYNFSNSFPAIYNSIFWGDTSGEMVFADPATPGQIELTDSIVQGGQPDFSQAQNLMTGDPHLGPLQNNGGFGQTMAPGAFSAAIDKGGVNAACQPWDERAVNRPQGPACDVGAYEVKVRTFLSTAANDGWVLESGKGTNLGGLFNASSAAVLAGDTAGGPRYRGFFSFNTAPLPDGATIISARLSALQVSHSGNPFTTQGRLWIDLAKPYFGPAVTLANTDWQATPTAAQVGSFGITLQPDDWWYSAPLNATGRANINKLGTTQLRLRFATETYNGIADYVGFASANDPTSADWARLTVYFNP